MQFFIDMLKNSAVAVLTVAGLGLSLYIILVILEWGLRIKSRGREQDGLTRLWSAAHKRAAGDREGGKDD